MKKMIITISLVSILAGCNGSGSNSTTSTDIQTGNFIDSAVKGLTYKTLTQESTTDAVGKFFYKDKEEVEFLLGDMSLGKALGATTLYPKDINADKEIEIARLLLTLDEDADASNGIDISYIPKNLTTGLLISAVDQNMVNYLREGNTNRTLKTEQEARDHLDQHKDFAEAILVADGKLTISTTFSQAMFDATDHRLSAIVALKDNTQEVTFAGNTAVSISADMSFHAQYANGDTGQIDENGRNTTTRTRLRSGLYLYMKNSQTGHSLGFYNRIEKDQGDNQDRLLYKAFVEHNDGQDNYQEVVYKNIDAYACETAQGEVTNQTLSIKKAVVKDDENEDDHAVIITCGSHELARIFIDDVLEDNFGVDPNVGSFTIHAIGLQTQHKDAAVGSVLNPSFDNIKINGQLVDDFSHGKINRDVWTYTRVKHY